MDAQNGVLQLRIILEEKDVETLLLCLDRSNAASM